MRLSLLCYYAGQREWEIRIWLPPSWWIKYFSKEKFSLCFSLLTPCYYSSIFRLLIIFRQRKQFHPTKFHYVSVAQQNLIIVIPMMCSAIDCLISIFLIEMISCEMFHRVYSWIFRAICGNISSLLTETISSKRIFFLSWYYPYS